MAASTLICILGAQNHALGELSEESLFRVGAAIRVRRFLEGASILPTGGWGPHFNTAPMPHWYYVKEYLLGVGVAAQDVLDGVDSSNTIEDFELVSQRLIKTPFKCVIFITSDYHVARASLIASTSLSIKHCFFPAILPSTLSIACKEPVELAKIRRLIDDL